ncbi:hypothetical protein SCLCIDRAFT_1071870 [Scleroderma citrinum Foug A]|uniref:Uncharacterized protein n=1 Tax=Scleroderma citrinum Foug A TaxID=1036808 RepID=A0A0C3EHT8_9AGAM|nr:hypothetical protein SCLCIDRAFT_1071870 [Scleroderma citrinum Foug A]
MSDRSRHRVPGLPHSLRWASCRTRCVACWRRVDTNNNNRRGPLTGSAHALRSPTSPAEELHRCRCCRRRWIIVLSCLSERDGHESRFPFPSDFAREPPLLFPRRATRRALISPSSTKIHRLRLTLPALAHTLPR